MLTKIEHGDVLELRLERPPVNALHHPLVQELRAAVEAAPSSGAKALVLSGVSGMYSAGLDVPWLLELDSAGMQAFWEEFFSMLKSVALSPIPVASAITGHSPAGGAVIAIFCDTRIAAQGKFKIGLNEVQVGLPVPRVILSAFVRLLGQRQAERLAVRGALISPDEALAVGLVDQVVAPDEVVPKAIEWCRDMLKLPASAMLATRKTLREDYARIFEAESATTRDEMTAVWFREDTQKALKGLVSQLAARKK
jgi:Delta3-Delta2-enoyl-CoA isomerase